MTDDNHGNQNHGNKTDYLDDTKKWKNFNPRIFNLLAQRIKAQQRSIAYCRQDNLVVFKSEFTDQLPDNISLQTYKKSRDDWHNRAKGNLKGCDLIFLDPDIGVKDGLSKDVVKDSEYCLVNEIEDYQWCDWLIVQFLARKKRYQALMTNPIVIRAEKQRKKVMVFIYGGMALLYISKTLNAEILSHVFKDWDTKVDTKVLVP